MPERNVLLICDFDPSGPLIGSLRVDRFASHLTNLGWTVNALSPAGITRYTREGRTAPDGAMESHYERPARGRWGDLVHRALLWVFYHLVAFPDRGVVTLPRILGHARGLGAWRPDVVVVSGPPFSTFLAGRHLAKQWGVPWVADYRDLWTNSTYYICGPIRRRIDRVAERRILRSVALTTTVSEPLAEDLRRDFGVRCEVVMNGFEPDEVACGASVKPSEGLPVRIAYTGEIYLGKRDPAPLFEAMRRLGVGPNEVEVTFRGITVMPLAAQAERYGVAGCVRVGPAMPRVYCLELQRASDVLLLMMWNNPGEAGIFSGKVFEYLGSGRPTLMLGYEHGAAANLLRERRAGVIANDPDEIARALAGWIEMKRETGAVPGTAADVTAGLTRRDQAVVLDKLLGELVAQPGGRDHGR
jgi:hypothetical protein